MTNRSATGAPEKAEAPGKTASKRQSPLDRLTALSAPTADIEQMIAEIGAGRASL
jgi:hypothetical protein